MQWRIFLRTIQSKRRLRRLTHFVFGYFRHSIWLTGLPMQSRQPCEEEFLLDGWAVQADGSLVRLDSGPSSSYVLPSALSIATEARKCSPGGEGKTNATKISRAVPSSIEHVTSKMYLRSLTEVFYTIYKDQLREFYCTMRFGNAGRNSKTGTRSEPENLDALWKTRNFGGCTERERNDKIFEFFNKPGMRSQDATCYTIAELIKQNLQGAEARPLLKSFSDANIVAHDADIFAHDREIKGVLWPSLFLGDQNDVKMVATNGVQLALVHCDGAVCESLYEDLDTSEMEFFGQRYVRTAHGASNKQYPIHHKFRAIVEKSALGRRCITGFHSDTLPSLVVALQDRTKDLYGMDVDASDAAEEKRMFGRTLQRLTLVTRHMSR